MTQEDKELLVRDLSARLLYNVKVKTPYNDAVLAGIVIRNGYKKGESYIDVITDKQTYPLKYIQPYLRPIKSITDEELVEFLEIKGKNLKSYELNTFRQQLVTIVCTLARYSRHIDWLNSHHFDYRGLIPKCLAIEVTKENNPYNE